MSKNAQRPSHDWIPPWGQRAGPWALFPAAAAGIATLAIVLWWGRPVRQELLIGRYRGHLVRALSAGDLDLAQVAARRLEQLTRYEPEARFQTALVLEAQGKTASALEIMEELANSSAHGIPKAQLWLAKKMLAQSPPNAVSVAAARRHLEKMLDINSDGSTYSAAGRSSSAGTVGSGSDDLQDARRLLAELYRAAGEPEKAIPLIEATKDSDPKTLYTLAVLHHSAGNRETAQLWARRAVRAATKLLSDMPGDSTNRVWLARAHVLLDEFPAAAQALAATDDTPTTTRHEAFLSEVYYRWAEHVAKRRDAGAAEQLSLLLRSLEHPPVYPLTCRRLAELSIRETEARSQIAAELENRIARGLADPTIHFLLGNIAWAEGDHAKARRHYEHALEAGTHAASIANNLAWAILQSESEPADLDVALELANRAVAKEPAVAEFRDTRGQILVKLERWNEAVTDLEAARPALPANRKLHEALAVAYRSLDNAPQAAVIERILQGIDEKARDSGTSTIESEISVPKVSNPSEANARDYQDEKG